MSDVKTCSVCGEEKSKIADTSKKSGIRHRCLRCVNERRRAQHQKRGIEINERKRVLYKEKYRESAEYKQRQTEKRARLKEKGAIRASYDRYMQRQREVRIVNTVGAFCEVHNRECVDCGKRECVRPPKRGSELTRCWTCHVKYVRHTKLLGRKIKRPLFTMPCKTCGVLHTAKIKNCNCPSCSITATRAHAKMYRRSHPRTDNRVRKHGALSMPFRRKDVFERDNYQCRMCGCATQKHSIYLPDAAELDHIIPLSKGGAHALYNMQTLCRRCNAIKSDRVLYTCTYIGMQRIVYDGDVSDVMYGSDPCQPCLTLKEKNLMDICLQHRRTSHAQAHAANKVSHL